jgi:hypothetical protein
VKKLCKLMIGTVGWEQKKIKTESLTLQKLMTINIEVYTLYDDHLGTKLLSTFHDPLK